MRATARHLLVAHSQLYEAKRLMGFEPTTFCMASLPPGCGWWAVYALIMRPGALSDESAIAED
jgi:hypothetical protein